MTKRRLFPGRLSQARTQHVTVRNAKRVLINIAHAQSNNPQIPSFLETNARGGPETKSAVGVVIWHHLFGEPERETCGKLSECINIYRVSLRTSQFHSELMADLLCHLMETCRHHLFRSIRDRSHHPRNSTST